ncbi:MAG: septum formation initiator family protein [Rikenellaceae bacterium]|nr:septum formation initiator family protein [Rikenellaceae bacterium]
MLKLGQDRRLWIGTIVVFVLLIVFFDANSVIDGIRLRRDIRELESRKLYYRERIVEDSVLLERLKENDFLEQYAREHFMMRKPGEEIYVIQQ